jgi:SET domain-containing protein
VLLVKAKVSKSPIHGNGLFAEKDIPRGTPVYCYDPSIDVKKPVEGASLQELHFGYISPEDGLLVICGDDSRWWNFGFPPNCEEREEWRNGERVVVATRDIREGEELLISVDTDRDASRKLML